MRAAIRGRAYKGIISLPFAMAGQESAEVHMDVTIPVYYE